MNETEKDLPLVHWRRWALLLSIATMLTGLLFSRVLLSSGLIIFAVLTLCHRNIGSNLRRFSSSFFLWSMTLLFFLPFVSGLWSEDISNWSEIVRLKLPLVVLPVCFASIVDLRLKDWRRIALVFLFLVLVGIGLSCWQYLQNTGAMHAAYLKAQLIQTPMGNDHVRFSLLVAVAILTAVYLLWQEPGLPKAIVAFVWAALILFVIYLHILAARTGLFCFYAGGVVYLLTLFWTRTNKPRYLLLLILILIIPVIAYFILPTFQNRINYLRYDLSLLQKKVWVPGSNDGDRYLSLRAGMDLLQKHPWRGEGFGDIQKATEQFYDLNYPAVQSSDRILPSSEWLMYGAGLGWPGLVLFSMILAVPFLVTRLKENIYWWLLNLFFAGSYLFDIGLEVQYGIFMHGFILLWWYRWVGDKKNLN